MIKLRFISQRTSRSSGIWEEFWISFQGPFPCLSKHKVHKKRQIWRFLSLFGHNSAIIHDDPKSSQIPLEIEVILMINVQENNYLGPSWSKMYYP